MMNVANSQKLEYKRVKIEGPCMPCIRTNGKNQKGVKGGDCGRACL